MLLRRRRTVELPPRPRLGERQERAAQAELYGEQGRAVISAQGRPFAEDAFDAWRLFTENVLRELSGDV